MALASIRLQVRALGLRGFGRLPRRVRRVAVRSFAPCFTVGTVCVVQADDGSVMLLRHSYRRGWGLPGGLLQRGEHADAAARREVLEEVGVAIDLDPGPTVVVDPGPRRVDVVFRARLRPGARPEEASPCSPEVLEVGWFRSHDAPPLHPDALAAVEAAGLALTGW